MGKDIKKLRVGIIGLGRISVMHLSSVENSEYAKLVACCDIKQERIDEVSKKYAVNFYTDYKQMIERENLDVVHVCLPHYLHVPVSVYAMEKGVNVISEKPMSIDLSEAKKAVKTAEKTGVKYGVIFQCRYNNSAKLVKNAVDSGKLGKIESVSSILTWTRPDSYYKESDWKGTWDKEGGGVVIDQAIHSIDLVNWIVGSKFKSVSCKMANMGHSFVKVEDTAMGLIEYENGVRYCFYCMNNYGKDEPIEIKMHCEKGEVVFGYDDAYIKYNDGTQEETHNGEIVQIDGAKDYWGFQHARQIEQFYKACLGIEELEISGYECLKTHELICEIYEKGGMRK